MARMRLKTLLKLFGLLAGSLILAIGLALAAIAAFQESFLGVFMGFSLFVGGYKLSQVAVRETDRTPIQYMVLQDVVRDILRDASLIDLFMAVIGTGTIAYGFTLLVQSVETTQLPLAVAATTIMFAGYAAAHYAVNNTLV